MCPSCLGQCHYPRSETCIDISQCYNFCATDTSRGGVHVTDVTNASRTLLMELHTLAWSREIASLLNIPLAILPEIRPSSDPDTYGLTLKTGPFKAEIPICAAIGDQQAALVGQSCFTPGDTKNTYGTGCFILTLICAARPVCRPNGRAVFLQCRR